MMVGIIGITFSVIGTIGMVYGIVRIRQMEAGE